MLAWAYFFDDFKNVFRPLEIKKNCRTMVTENDKHGNLLFNIYYFLKGVIYE